MNVFQFISSVFSLVFIGCLFVFPFVVYRTWYPKRITCIKLCRGSDPLVYPVKPNKSFFRSVTLGRASSFVTIGNGYSLFYVADAEASMIDYNDISVSSEIYIFSRSRFGRFRSVDLSDRCLMDSLKKFISKEV